MCRGLPERSRRAKYQARKERTMDFAIILILSNTFLAVLIYVVVTRIWQD